MRSRALTGPDPRRAALDMRVLAWMREPRFAADEARFDDLARDLFAFQFAHCAPYARFCEGRGCTPESVGAWREIPAVPTGAFKELALRSFPGERGCHVFLSSGTSTQRRGELHLDTLELYETSLLASFEHFVLPDLPGPDARLRFLMLAPSPVQAPDSSLSHMLGVVLQHRGDAHSFFAVRDGSLQVDAALAALDHAADEGRPLVLCGTAFAFVHLLDCLNAAGRKLALPPGSRVMETGGFKGRSRELTRDALYAAFEERLGVPGERCVNQYGMTELGSQFYDVALRCSVIGETGEPRRKLGPPWARVRILDPTSGAESAPGEPGVVVIIDLANTGSVLAIQTADVGRSVDDGFEVLGREPGAEARGCSLAADAMLGEASRP